MPVTIPGARVILVEDSPDLRVTATVRLWQVGYVTVQAASASDAIEVLQDLQTQIGGAFTEMILGGASGYGLETLFRQHWPAGGKFAPGAVETTCRLATARSRGHEYLC